MKRRIAFALVSTAAVFLAACSDGPTAPPTLTRLEAQRVADMLPDDVPGLMEVLFQGGNAKAAQARWNTVQRFIASGNMAQAQKHMFDVADYTLKKQRQGHLRDPDAGGPATVQTGVTKLLSLMFNRAFPDAPDLPETTVGDAVVTLVDGSAQTAVTPAKKAGIELSEGSTDTPFILVIDQNPTQELYLERCSGPLPTTRCQFPLFYNFTPYPYTRLKKMAKFGVCTIGNHGESRHPRGPRDEAQHERLRLAHPAHPERNNHPVVDGITIVPLVPIDFLDCEDTSYPLPPSDVVGSTNPVVRGVMYAASRLGGAVARALTPRNLYAIDRGGGGEDDFFSPWNSVDPSETRADPNANFVGIWNGTINSGDGEWTQPVTLIIDGVEGTTAGGEFRVSEPGGTVAYNDGALRFFNNGQIDGATLTFTLFDEESGIEGVFNLTKSGDVLAGTIVETFGDGEGDTRNWTMNITRGTTAAISPPVPPPLPEPGAVSARVMQAPSGGGFLRKP